MRGLQELLTRLKEEENYRQQQGVNLHGVSSDLSEWNFGFSEGLAYAIEEIEKEEKMNGKK